jgi:predicted nuclease of restriction endonuclease-like (RecB) superfamily
MASKKDALYQTESYRAFLNEIKRNIQSAQIKAALSVNRSLIELYLEIGDRILFKQEQEQWGMSVVERLSKDLKISFPHLKGFSPRNLWDMRRLSKSVQGSSILRQLVAEIPWGHNLVLLNKIKTPAEREWYIRKTVEHGWSRSLLELQIEKDLYSREGKAISNFNITLPLPQSDLVQQTFKDPYIFDFLNVGKEAQERAIEAELVRHITKFLLELGVGFAFVGQQYHLQLGQDDFYIDLLFYHLKLRCYVVIELKASRFKPEYVGKLNFYLSAVDDLLRVPEDKPSIGLILCASKDNVQAEYALRDINKPIGVAEWKDQLTRSLPERLQTELPTIEELEAELEAVSVEVEEEE